MVIWFTESWIQVYLIGLGYCEINGKVTLKLKLILNIDYRKKGCKQTQCESNLRATSNVNDQSSNSAECPSSDPSHVCAKYLLTSQRRLGTSGGLRDT